METKVSICIPVYNGERTIREVLQSVLQQTYEDYEVVIIDNCSTDDTIDVIKDIHDSRITLFQNEKNIGMAGNWNECLKKARGEYIHFLCADDLLEPDCLREKVKIMEENPDVVIVTSATDIVDENGKVLMHRDRFKKNCLFEGVAFAKKSMHRANLFGEPSNIMLRCSATEKAGLFSENTHYTTDWEYWIRVATFGKIAYLQKAMTQYRVSNSNVTSSIKLKKMLKDDSIMMENLEKSGLIEITLLDKVIHKVMLTMRDIARIVYMKLRA